ncbi:MAG: TolC family protein [Tidjanibacter sp.]|nr:TolC family protein [Tidjanibacter sp.]
MRKRVFLTTVLPYLFIYSGSAQVPCDTLRLSLSDALAWAEEENSGVRMAAEGVRMAQQDKLRLRSAWWPTISLTGEAIHTTTPIELTRTVDNLTDGALDAFDAIVAANPPLESILQSVREAEIGVELAPRNTASVGVAFAWPVFSGGKRVAATKAGELGVKLAGTTYDGVRQRVWSATLEAYFGVQVARLSVDVCEQALASSLTLVRQARSLEREGMINKAERLAAEVGASTMAAELAGAHTRLAVAEAGLGALLGIDSLHILPTTPLFVLEYIPSQAEFIALLDNNPTIRSARVEQRLAEEGLRLEQSRYLPDIALVGGHRLWSEGIDRGLVPRTFVGVAASWTLFDGANREYSVAKSRSLVRLAGLAEQQRRQELEVQVRQLYGTLQQSLTQLSTMNSTVDLAQELARMRHKAFTEGMATSSEVVQSEVALAEARLGRIAVLYQWNIAWVELLALCGKSPVEQIEQLYDYEE